MNAKIVIASTLKPVIDPRAFEKIGKSLAATGNYDIHIIGANPTTKEINSARITLHPIHSISRNVFTRVLIPWKVFIKIRALQPSILIVSTHELLIISAFYKIISHCKLVYDIIENYHFNLLYQHNYVWGLRHLLGAYVRLKEILTCKFVDHFILAEKCYAEELTFIGNKFTVIENKYKPPSIERQAEAQQKIELLLSGTISQEYGVFDAIDFYTQLPSQIFTLVIVGHCPNTKTYHLLKERISRLKGIKFMVSTSPIPHDEILKYIGPKTIGLLPYQANKSTENKVPTKLYEYIGLNIKVIISANPVWREIVEKYNAGWNIDFKKPYLFDYKKISLSLIKTDKHLDLKDILWNSEEIKLIPIIDALS